MPKKQRKNKRQIGSVLTIILITIAVVILTTILYLLNFEGSKTTITATGLETSLVTLKNILSTDGVRNFFGNILTNFKTLEPIFLLIMSLIGISICQSSGLIKIFFAKLKKKKSFLITAIVLFFSIVTSFMGNYSYTLILPISALLYKEIGRNPVLGILTAFIGITLGNAAGLVFSYDDYTLGMLTQSAATLDVDKNYVFDFNSSIFILTGSLFILLIFGSQIIEKFLTPKFKKIAIEEDELVVSKKALFYTYISVFVFLLITIYMITPGLYGSGILLDNTKDTYIAKLFSPTAPFKEGIIFIILVVMMVSGYIYGKISGNIDNNVDYVEGLSVSFSKIGYILVLLLFSSILFSTINYTNIGEVLIAKTIDFVSSLSVSGIPLILISMASIIFLTIIVPDLNTKWILISPLLVPLFMKSNITPDFTQFIFKVSDSIGKSLTPVFPYFIVMLGFIDKYKLPGETYTLSKVYSLILKPILLFMVLWIVIVIGWYVIGMPMGINTFPTL